MQNNKDNAKKSLFQQIKDMSVAQRIELARKASKEARAILLRDSNRVVQMAAVQSPKITDSEILMVANNRQIEDDILRYIISRRDWMKNYQIKVALTNNPKTPLPIALRLIASLTVRDLSLLSKSKSVPRPLMIAADRRLKEMKR